MASLFGTDGVRGLVNRNLTPELAYHLARAGAKVLLQKDREPLALIGKDTRRSCDMLESALCAGFFSQGISVVRLGILPTPGVAWLTRSSEAGCGVMISASHNPAEYNGIKFFDHDGYKLADSAEAEMEELLTHKDLMPHASYQAIGCVVDQPALVDQYRRHLVESVDGSFAGLSVTLDTAYGAAHRLAPDVFEMLGARVHVIHQNPDGFNINRQCGSTHPEKLQAQVREDGSDIGLAFDGDADRLIAVDEQGQVVDGDQIMALLAVEMKKAGRLAGNTLVATVMSNLGLEQTLRQEGCEMLRTKVGDRHVLEEMKRRQLNLGGEQSGHIILSDYNTTGDGLLTALKVTALLKKHQKPLSSLAGVMKHCPQVLVNAHVQDHLKEAYITDPVITREIQLLEKSMDGTGRVLIRPSGTESMVRVMLEGQNQEQLTTRANNLARIIEQRLG